MFLWVPIPDRFRALGSMEFARLLLRESDVVMSPGVGFGPEGEGYVRFALIEEEERLRAAGQRIGGFFERRSGVSPPEPHTEQKATRQG